MVVLDHLAKLSPGIKIITIDTDFLFEETYALRELVQRRYPIQLEIRKSHLTPATQTEAYHPELWKVDPNKCCHIRKVVPLCKVFEGLDAWFAGLRRDQSTTRNGLGVIGWDAKNNLVKINPLVDWTRAQVWKYIVENNVPYNPLHDQGYASIGCVYCTKATGNHSDERAGRWAGSNKTECGIHI
jgi:phosphoadenosine phosphosulfate reductase